MRTSRVGDWASAQLDLLLELALGVRDAAPGAAEGEARAQDGREAGVADDGARLVDRVGDARPRARQPDLLHGGLEERAVFGLGDGLGAGAEHLDAELLEHALVAKLHGQVERRLAAQRRQEGLGPLLLDDGGHRPPLERLDVRARRELRDPS